MRNETVAKRTATASYIENMLQQLGVLAVRIDCDFLVLLLEMAQQEAADIMSKGPSTGRSQTGKSRGDDEFSAEELAAIFVQKYSKKR
ncbi:MAG: hypothetical protein GKR97_15305 [Rhizobiaceae bacterium]|nr:hypothetical protein [Rhizobiaceae bacterium]